MKKIICTLIVLSTILFSACSVGSSNASKKIKVINNDAPIIQPTKSDKPLNLIESDKSNYEFVTTLTQKDLSKLIPDEFSKYDSICIVALDDGVIYFSTEIGFGKDRCSKDIFSYSLENNTITHIADISSLNTILLKVFEVNGNYYFNTINSSSDEKLILYDNGNFTTLTDDFFLPVETENGIAFSQLETHSIVEFEGKKQIIITPEIFPSIVLKRKPLTYISLTNGHIWLCTIENKSLTSILELPSYAVEEFPDFFWLSYGDYGNETETVCMYNYNNEELISFEDKRCSAFGGNGIDTIFRLDFDGNIWQYKYDKENNVIIKAILEGTKDRTFSFGIDNNYIMRCYYNSYNPGDYAYDIYVEK